MAKKLTEEQVLSIINQNIANSDDWNNSQISGQRVDAYDYYFGTLPVQPTKGRSRYVSLDVQDATETLMASLLNVFAGERQIMTFRPNSIHEATETEQANKAIDFVINNQNDQYQIHYDVMFDGLLCKNGVSKIWFCKEEDSFDFPFEGSRDELDMLLAEDESISLKEEHESEQVDRVTPIPGTEFGQLESVELVQAVLTKQFDSYKVKIDPVPPEEFLIDDKASCTEDAVFTCHQREVTLADLAAMGFSRKKIEEVGVGTNETKLSTDQERIARHQFDNRTDFWESSSMAGDSMKYVTLYEVYLRADFDGTGSSRMKQFFVANDVILESTDVDRNPFEVFVPFPISHKFYGQSVADRLASIQTQKTKLTRAILDNAELNNNTRFVANVNSLLNPRELTDTRFGGVVRAKGDPNGIITELAKPQLSPQTFPTVELLEREKESRVGVNRISQGLNEDALKPGVAARKVSQLISVGLQRQKMVARQYANYWKRVVEYVYELVVANYPYLEIPNPTGEPVILEPQKWKTKRIATLTESLAFGEAEAKAQQLMAIDQTLSGDVSAQDIYTQANKLELWKEVYNLLGYQSPFITETDPNKPSPIQRQQLELQQQTLQQQQRQLQMAEETLALRKAQLELEQQKAQSRAELEEEKVRLDAMNKADTQQLEEEKLKVDAQYKADQIDLEQQKVLLKQQLGLIEAEIERTQGRGVSLGN